MNIAAKPILSQPDSEPRPRNSDEARRTSILSVNLEDYFQVAPLRRVISPRHWTRFDLRVEKSTLATLDLLDRHGARATFFTLGWIAKRCPDLVAEVARRGHEIASKGFHHRAYDQLDAEEFRADFLRSRDAIERATGKAVLGYRIAEGTLPTETLEPFEILAREGVRYDSSVRPFGPRFVRRGAWRHVRELAGDGWSITEMPLSSSSILGIPVPVTGGNYLRQIPGAVYDRLLASYWAHANDPWHFYFHVWELDPEQPRITAIASLERMRQYRNLSRMHERIEAHLAANRFVPAATYLGLEAPVVEPRAAEPAEETVSGIPAGNRTSVTIVVPCFNEEATLPYLAGTLESFERQNRTWLDLSYVFVDDGSADRTWEVLHEQFGDRENCSFIRHPRNRGIAAATMSGIRGSGDEIVCGIDCDCSFDPHTLADMIPLLTDGVDMVQASPYHKDGGVMNVPGWRLVLSRTLSRIYRRLLNHRFASYTACFRVYRRSRIKDVTLDDEGFLGIAEMFIRLDQSGARIIEFPAVLESRLIGVSKMKTLSVILAHVGMLAKLVRSRLGGSSTGPVSGPPVATPETR